MKEVVAAALSKALILSPGFSTNLMTANAEGNSTQHDMKQLLTILKKAWQS
jgi:hypothetical protein